MENTGNNLKVMAWVLAALFALSAAGAIFYLDKSRDMALSNQRMNQRLDSLRTTKIQLDKKNNDLSGQLENAQDSNQLLTGQVNEVNALLSRKDADIRNLHHRYNFLTTRRDNLQAQLAKLNEQTERMKEEKGTLASTNLELSEQIETLNRELTMLVPRNEVTADGFRVEALKSNDKVTAKAKKVRTLKVSFVVPAELKLEGLQEVYLSLDDQQHNNGIKSLSSVTVAKAGASLIIPVHAVKTVDFHKASQSVSLTIQATDEFKPQTYRASVFTKNSYLGSVEFTLRDSFWFF